MRLEDFSFELPEEQIARRPLPRGRSRLLVLDRSTGRVHDSRVSELGRWLDPGDLLVRNDVLVVPARLRGRRGGEGRTVEALLVEEIEPRVWVALCRPAKRIRAGDRLRFANDLWATCAGAGERPGTLRLGFEGDANPLAAGEIPLPPYLGRDADEEDAAAYQTIYAKAPGAIAAPTAGLHFRESDFEHLAAGGVDVADVTLHVGPGTFLPVRTADPRDHDLWPERAVVPSATVEKVAETRARGGRVVALGTTTLRALEGAFEGGRLAAGERVVDLYVLPGFRFRVVDAMVTNFHLPRSTLLMLVAAFAGRERILETYRGAIERGYRFYSYGDAMLIL